LAPPHTPGRTIVPSIDGGVEQRTHPVLLHLRLRFRLQLGRQIERVVERRALLGEGGRPGRKRLRRRRFLARHVALRHGPLFDRPHRHTGDTIEDVGESLLGQLHHGVDLLSADRDRHEVRRRPGS
jgi:hypothetical protein